MLEEPRLALPRRRLVVVTIGLLLSLMLSALDTSVVATAMPRIVSDLAGLELYAWVTTAYLVASTTIIPISGKLGDLFGRKRFLQGGTVGFLVASALCGLSQSMPELVVARGVQGVFGGVITSSAVASLADLYLPAARARMHGVFTSVFALAAIGGPIVGGVLTDQLGWRSVFYVNVPLGIGAAIIVALTMPRVPTKATLRYIDVRGAFFLAALLVPLLTALTVAREGGVASPLVVGLFLLAAGILGAFVRTELRAVHPVMPLVLFRTPTFTVAIAVSFLSTFGMYGSNIFVSLLFQGLLGVTPTQAGVLITPRMIGMIAASLVSGQIVSRMDGYRFVSVAGLGMLAIGLFLLSRVTPSSGEDEVVRDLLLTGIGFGSTQPIYQNAVMSAVPRRFVGVASSQVQFWKSLGQTVGVTVLGAVLASQIDQGIAEPGAILPTTAAAQASLASGLHLAFLVAATAAGAAAIVALFLKEVPLRGRRPRAEPPAIVEAAVIGSN